MLLFRQGMNSVVWMSTCMACMFPGFFQKPPKRYHYWKQLLISNDRNRIRWAVLDLLQDRVCTDLFENHNMESLKRDLPKGATFNPPLFSLVNSFKRIYYLGLWGWQRPAHLSTTVINQVQNKRFLVGYKIGRYRSRVHGRSISLRFLGTILRVLRRMQCLHYTPVSNHFCLGGGGGKPLSEVTVNSKEENS
jgi:hypothetical protein